MTKLKLNLVAGHVQIYNNVSLTMTQMKYVSEIIEFFKGKTILTQREIRDAALSIKGTTWGPYWIIKNHACRNAKFPHMFDLSKFKLLASEAKAALNASSEVIATPAVEGPALPAPAAAKKIEAKKPRKEKSRAKKGSPIPAVETAATPHVETEQERDAREDKEREAAIAALEIFN
jgi:hypothetical protein